MTNPPCLDCGSPVPPWGKSKTRFPDRCPDCRSRYLKRYQRDYQRRRLGITENENTCPQCGAAFVSSRENRKYCSVECRREALRAPKRACEGCGAPIPASRKSCDACRQCPYPDCGRPKTRGGEYCADHRRQLLRERRETATCSVVGCETKVYATELCKLHYNRKLYEGDVGPVGRRHPRLPERYVFNGYVMVLNGHGRREGEHRVVMERVLGRRLRKGESVHHKNGVRDDNRPENLELWVTPPRYGQRVTDLVQWIVDMYPDETMAALRQPQLLNQT